VSVCSGTSECVGGSPMMPFLTLCELSPLSNEEEDVDSVGEGEGDSSCWPVYRAADSLSDDSV